MKKFLLRLSLPPLCLIGLVLGGCGDSGYYLQAMRGQMEILNKRRPIAALLADPDLPAAQRERLDRILQMRDFASRQLALPDNGSYRSYVDLGRPYPLWNLVAAPEFSLQAKTWCFPIAGCVNYRGYFNEADARQLAAQLRQQSYDTLVYGVPAYSTLSWFDDPVLSSFSNWPAPSVARLIFHELAHQQLYLKGDSDFSEAFATSVALEGVKRWLAAQGSAADRGLFALQLHREEDFLQWSAAVHQHLATLYAKPVADQQKRQEKAEILDNARQEFEQLKRSWGGYTGYDRWIGDLNNAHLVSLKTYRRWLPAFTTLLAQVGGDLPTFYARCKELSEQPAEARRQQLDALASAPLQP